MLIVNTVSKCGFTHQYVGLEKLGTSKAKYRARVLFLPSFNFCCNRGNIMKRWKSPSSLRIVDILYLYEIDFL